MKIVEKYLGLGLLALLMACSGGAVGEETAVSNNNSTGMLTLPSLTAVDSSSGRLLQVVASTSIIGDVVAQVGGEAIELTTLMASGQDPHSFEPGAQALTAVAQADIVFVNGWNLEESLASNLETISGNVPVVPISANIQPLHLNDGAEEHDGADPHVWFDIENVAQWVENVVQVLSTLDPANATVYQSNGEAYRTQLTELDQYVTAQLTAVPPERRVLVTNHDSFSYFAQAYDFEILGTVVPGLSSIAEPSANDLSHLIEVMAAHNVCTIFTENTSNSSLAQTVADELAECDAVQVIPLYSGSVGKAGSGAESYISMFRTNVDAIVAGLK